MRRPAVWFQESRCRSSPMDPLLFLLLCVCLWPTCARASEALQGDVLLLLDSSGSISSSEFGRLLLFVSGLLEPLPLGPGGVRVGLVQVGTEPRLEFGLDAIDSHSGLQEALSSTQQLGGVTNTPDALRLVESLISPEAPPTVLLWLTDGVEPGVVDGPMAVLRGWGLTVMAVCTGRGNYQQLQRTVTPPTDTHLYFVDIDDIDIITDSLRNAIITALGAPWLRVGEVGSRSALLQWRPWLRRETLVLHYRRKPSDGSGSTQVSAPADTGWAQLPELTPDTAYTAWIHTADRRTLRTSFRTLPDGFGPSSLSVWDRRPERLRVSWAPVRPHAVQLYRLEYGEIPGGPVRTLTLLSSQSSALLTELRPLTEYLITVTALHSSGQQRAMSVRACTPEAVPPLADLRLTPEGWGSLRADWWSHEEKAGLLGYWVSWRSEDEPPSPSSSRFLPPHTHSTLLTGAQRVCVTPVYERARGAGLCCTHTHTEVN